MRSELLRRAAADQSVREQLTRALQAGNQPDSSVIANMLAVDSANTAWLRDAVERRGWPGRSSVGDDGAAAAFLLVQHSDRDTAFQARVLAALEAVYRSGEVQGQEVALLTDRLSGARGKPQVYGTQATVRDGRVVLDPIIDSASVDARRAELGLPPIRDYLRVLDSVYLGKPSTMTR